jgi:hypothetical protein
MVREKSKEGVHVIRHHAPRIHPVTRRFEVHKRLSNDISDRRQRQKALTDAGVQFRLNPLADEFLEPLLFGWRERTSRLLCGRYDVPFLKFKGPPNVVWQRIGEPKRHEIYGVVGFPVWESAAGTNVGHGRNCN